MPSSVSRITWSSIFMLSAATLAFEINLTRLYSVTQFYHFAFMIVSVALLGFGASGTFLALFPKFGQRNPAKTVSWLCIASGMFMLASYLLLNWLPFDSFSISVDRRQVVILTINYLILAAPFLFSGMAVALLLKTSLEHVGAIYAINLAGSACGCILALIWPTWMGGEGTSIMASCLAGLAALPAMIYSDQNRWSFLAGSSALTILVFYVVGELLFYASTGSYTSFLELHISPYKGLSYILQYPDAMIVSRRWNSYSVVDRVRSDSIRSLPGLSYRYNQLPPAQDGLLVDGDELSPIILAGASTDYADYMPAALAFHLQPEAEVLVLEPRGGLDISTALSLGARRVTAVEVNPLIIEAAGEHYNNRRVQVIHGTGRSFLRQTSEHYDIAMISLINTYHPVRSGAYSLTEDYRNTIEAFQDGLARLKPEGILVVTRWLQSPPSEFLRAFATCLTALENIQASPKTQLIAYRGYQTGTILVKKSAFTPDELQATRDFLAQRGFDLVYAPDIRGDETNRFNILPESVYYEVFTKLINTTRRVEFYRTYPYDVRPPTDDHPFFGHYFKWSQAPNILAELGQTWQPFGGAGYFVILALLVLAMSSTAILILAPVAFQGYRLRSGAATLGAPAFYFAMIGLAYLLVEIPLIQRFILYLGHPAYALAVVLFSLLIFSGAGSLMSHRYPIKIILAALVFYLVGLSLALPKLFDLTLGLNLPIRLGLTGLALAPPGFLMGIPFAAGVRLWVGDNPDTRIPWIWAVNGSASVISAVLAALLALTFGFSRVLYLGACCYGLAWLTISYFGSGSGEAASTPPPVNGTKTTSPRL